MNITIYLRLRTLIRVVLTLALLDTFAATAYACSCVSTCKPESVCTRESFQWAAAVFVGTPVEITLQHGEMKLGDRTFPTTNYYVRFAVKEAFKGIRTPYAVADTGSGGGDCSYGKMDKGRDYLIYSGSISANSVVDIHLCSRTKPLDGGLGDELPSGSKWSESSLKSIAETVKENQKELRLLRKLCKRNEFAGVPTYR